MIERIAIVDTPSPGEVIAVYKNEDGTLRNITIKDPALQEQLRSTPPHLPNPEYVALTEQHKALTEQLTVTPPTVPNPGYDTLTAVIFETVEEQLAAAANQEAPANG